MKIRILVINTSQHTKIQIIIPASTIVKMARTNIGQLSKIDDVTTFWYTSLWAPSFRSMTSIPGTSKTGRYLLYWLPLTEAAVTGKLRSGSVLPCSEDCSKTSSVSPCSWQFPHDSLITSDIMPDNTPSLSNGLGVIAVVTVFSQRQVSAIKNEHKIL